MYQVYCDDWLLHDVNVLGLLLVNPKLDLEVNKTGNFTFSIYPTHPYYSRLKKLESIIVVKQNEEIIFRGRILNDEKGMKNEKQVTCEGELAFLLDTVQRPYEFQGDIPTLFEQFITAHNAQVEDKKQFKVGQITVTDPNNYINRSDTQYLSTYDSIFKKLIDTHGGYLNFRHEPDGVYIDYLEDFTKLNPQDIQLRKNILDLKEITKGENIFTALIPLGAKITSSSGDGEEGEEGGGTESESRLTISSVNDGKDYVYDAEAVERFGWIFATKTWDDVTEPSNLLRKANEELAGGYAFDKSLEITAVDLYGTDKSIAAFRIGTYNNVYSDVHDIEELLLVTKQSINLTNPAGDKLTLGVTFKSFTDQDKDNNDQIGNVVEKVEEIIKDYEVNNPIIEDVLNRLTVELSSNHPLTQNCSPGSETYQPDYTETPLIITPVTKYRGEKVQCTFVWKRIVDGAEADLRAYETVGENGVLTVSQNMEDYFSIYRCYATYRGANKTLVDNAQIEYSRVLNGDGVPGEPGDDGRTSYFHVKYSAVENPTTTDQMTEEPSDYIGTYVDFLLEDSTDPLMYTWARFRGYDGEKGIPGKNGDDGSTSYLHIKYSDDGGSTFTANNGETPGEYIGQYTDFTELDSSDPKMYKWALIKGKDGQDGTDGKDAAVQGDEPPEDKTLLWVDTSVNPPLLKRWNGEEWVIVNDTSEEINSLREELVSAIEQESTSIRTEVSDNYYLKDDAETLVESIGTEFEQTKREFEFTFNEFQQNLDDIQNGTNAEFQKIQKYIRFVDGKILLGEVGNELELQIQNDRISFLQNNAEVAYFSNRKMYVTDSEHTHSLTIGNFAFIPRENGNLSFKKVK